MTTRTEVVEQARTWLGTPWMHQQRMKSVGVDCAGLIIGVARELSLVAPEMDVSHYARVPDGISLLAHCDAWMTRIGPADIQPGDVVAIRFAIDPQHLALVGNYLHGGLSLIHSLDRAGKPGGSVIEHRLDSSMRRRIVAAFHIPGVA